MTVYRSFAFLLAAMLLPSVAVASKDPSITIEGPSDKAEVSAIMAAFQSRDLVKALTLADSLVAQHVALDAKESRTVYSADDIVLAAVYGTPDAARGKNVLIRGGSWAFAYFIKGYILVEAGRSREARDPLERAVKLAPLNAQYLSELGNWYLSNDEGQKALDVYRIAEDTYAMLPDEVRSNYLCLAKRGLAHSLIVLGNLDAAEAKYQECLAIVPGEPKSVENLRYVSELRKGKKP